MASCPLATYEDFLLIAYLNKETPIMMLEPHQDAHPNTDGGHFQQQLFMRYQRIKNRKESELTLDEKLFLENFDTAMRHLWGVQNITPTSLDSIIIPTE